ncbi:MAG TPA: hypothetical protein VMT15_08505 [Bryobacteraceae bacterium]|nr:hypothetical protein [Bryobacteraceae bacterium]
MTCQECELLLGNGENASEHLASCADCRGLEEELRLNGVALREMRVRPVRWHWAVAAAAAVVMAIGVWSMAPGVKPASVAEKGDRPLGPLPPPRGSVMDLRSGQSGQSPFPGRPVKARRKTGASEPLKVKMLTSDPDVVIYWIVDRKEGTE